MSEEKIDESDLDYEAEIDRVIAAHPEKFEQACKEVRLLDWFAGRVMKATGGKADLRMVRELLSKRAALALSKGK